MTSLPLSVQVNFWVDLMISNRHAHIVYIGLAFPKINLGNSLICNSGSSGLYLGTYVLHMCSGDDTNNLHILNDLGFRAENQVKLPFMSPVPVVSALGT